MTQCGLAKCAKFAAHKPARPIPVEISALAYLQAAGAYCYLFPERPRLTELKLHVAQIPALLSYRHLLSMLPRKELV
jgi:hypothetical protein